MFCMRNYDPGLKALSRREALCSAGPSPIKKRESEKGTTTTSLRQRLMFHGDEQIFFIAASFATM